MTVYVGVEVTVVLGIAVAEARCRETMTVVVNHHRAETDLVAPVPVHIGHAIVVIALTVP